LLGVTGGIEALGRAVPLSVVRGIQLSIGLSLLTKGVQMVAAVHVWLAANSLATGLAAVGLVLAFAWSAAGIVVAMAFRLAPKDAER
jgi:hypothetical protein